MQKRGDFARSKQAAMQDGEGGPTRVQAPVNKAHLEGGALKSIQSLLEAIQGIRSANSTQRSIGRSNISAMEPIVCWKCRKEGHIQCLCTEEHPDLSSQSNRSGREGASVQARSGNDQLVAEHVGAMLG